MWKKKSTAAFVTVAVSILLISIAFAQRPFTVKEKQLYYGIKAVAAPEQFKQFEKLSGRERAEWLRMFWAPKDPTPTTPENEFYEEHQRRVAHAVEIFCTARPGPPWDDRGEIYIRYGEPDERNFRVERHYSRQMAAHSAYELRDVISDPLKYRSLVAHRLANPERDFGGDISDEPSASIARGSFTLRPRDEDLLRDPKAEFLSTRLEFAAVSGEVWRYYRYGLTFQFQDEQNLGYFGLVPYIDAFGTAQDYQQFVRQAVVSLDVQKEIYQHDYGGKAMDYAFTVIRFRAPNKVNYVVDVNLGLPLEKLGVGGDSVTGEKVECMRRIVLYDENYQPLATDSTTLAAPVSADSRKGRLLLEQKRYELKPGRYILAVEVRDLATQKIGIYKKELLLPEYIAPDVQEISDVELASHIRPANEWDKKYRHKELVVMPQPSRVFFPDQTLQYYFEVYNLKKDKDGKARFSVTPEVYGYRTRKVEYSFNPRDLEADTTDIYQTGKLNLRDLTPGEYILSLKVKDRITGKEKTALAGFKVAKSE